MKTILVATVAVMFVCLTGNAMANDPIPNVSQPEYFVGADPVVNHQTLVPATKSPSAPLTPAQLDKTVKVLVEAAKQNKAQHEGIVKDVKAIVDGVSEMARNLAQCCYGGASEQEVNSAVVDLFSRLGQVEKLPSDQPKVAKIKKKLKKVITKHVAAAAKKEAPDRVKKEAPAPDQTKMKAAEADSAKIFVGISQDIRDLEDDFVAEQKAQDDEIARLKDDQKRQDAELERLKSQQMAQQGDILDIDLDQKNTSDRVDAIERNQDLRSRRQDDVVNSVQAETEIAQAKAERAEKKAEEALRVAKGKADPGLLEVGLESFFTTSGSLKTLSAMGSYVIRKDAFRVGIGGSAGVTLEGDSKFFFNNRLRLAYSLNEDLVWLGVFFNSFSAGMPYSDTFGLGGAVSLQFNIPVSDNVALGLELWGGPECEWDKRKLAPPAGIQTGEVYQTDEYQQYLNGQLGFNVSAHW
ncbi:MAG: hypothetical protein PHD72_01330 [Patescibacteria group bacterium]|nr:hypothetical protein [Patescibacteria group bacterium]